MKQSNTPKLPRLLAPLLLATAALLAAPAQAQALNENFGAAVAGDCPSTLPAGWSHYNGDGLTPQYAGQFTWPASNPGWATFGVSDDLLFTGVGGATNCAAVSTSYYDPPGQADDWLVSPQVTVPAGAKLRYRARGEDGYEVRWATTANGPDLLANSTVLLTVPTEQEFIAWREIDLAALAGQAGHISFRNTTTQGYTLSLDDVWLGVPAPGEHPITANVTSDPAWGELICPSSAPSGGTAVCSALARPGYVFDNDLGVQGCDEPGDTLSANRDFCTLGNVQGPRSLSANFLPAMSPPTNVTAQPDGAGNVTIRWTRPQHTGNSSNTLHEYSVFMAAWPLTSPPTLIGAPCPGDVTSCVVPNYQAGTAYVVSVRGFNGRGGLGHNAESSTHETLQVATLDLPGGGGQQATLHLYGAPTQDPANTCALTGAPTVATPTTGDLQTQSAPLGSTAPQGVLQLNAANCEGRRLRAAVHYPAGTLAGLQPWVRGASSWQPQGSITGDTFSHSLTGPANAGGALGASLAPLNVPLTYTLGGTVAGLTGMGLHLSNAGRATSVSAGATSFTFSHPVVHGDGYNVTVLVQPTGQTCTVTGGSGNNVTANVTSVQVNCVDSIYPITVSPPGSLICTSTTVIHNGTASCTAMPPPGQATQSISGCYGSPTGVGVDAYTTGPVTSACTITATFAPLPTHTLGGTATGLTAGGLVLRNGSENLLVPANGGFAFTQPVTQGGSYAVTIAAQPAGQRCTVANASGSNVTASVNNVAVACAPYFEGTTVPASGPGGTGSATFSGGGPGCRFDLGATAFEAAPATPPPGHTLPQGVLRFKLMGCTTAPVAMEVTWPEPVTGYTKHGLVERNATQPSYFAPTGLNISGHTARFTVTDGQQGDDDWTENGEIADPTGPTAPTASPGVAQPIPTLSEGGVALLATLLGLLALRRRV